MPGARVVRAAVESLARDPVAHRTAVDPLQRIAVGAHDEFGAPLERLRPAPLDHHAHVPRRVFAVDAIALDPRLQQLEAFDRDAPGALRVVARELPLDRLFTIGA